jgi:hypothetical protein
MQPARFLAGVRHQVEHRPSQSVALHEPGRWAMEIVVDLDEQALADAAEVLGTERRGQVVAHASKLLVVSTLHDGDLTQE